MKNYVKFNQGNFVKIGKEKNIKVDTIDGTLFDWIRTFMLSGRAMKKIIDNKLYIWVSYQAIREDNPLCNITSNDAVGRRLNKLIDLGLLKKFLSKEDGNKTFFCITEFAYTYLLEDRELPTQKSDTYLLEDRELPTQKSEGLPTQKSDNSKLNNSQIDSKLNREIIEKEKSPISEIIDYLNFKAGTNYKSTTDKTKSLIKARMNEGFTVEDFKTVIDKKVLLWKNDIKMSAYIRPETLFGTKFESYLNEIVSGAKVMSANGVLSEKTARGFNAAQEFLND